jgi:hypothetical protein
MRMSFMKDKTPPSKFDLDPDTASPLDAAISAQDRETLALVASALRERRSSRWSMRRTRRSWDSLKATFAF